MLNEERAIVSDIPGTTRDTIEEVLNINGIDFRLVDTAGIREASDTIEQLGIERTMDKISSSSLLVYVYDLSSISPEEVEKDLETIKADPDNTIIIANKTDLATVSAPDHHISISAKQDNADHIKSAIAEQFGDEFPTGKHHRHQFKTLRGPKTRRKRPHQSSRRSFCRHHR